MERVLYGSSSVAVVIIECFAPLQLLVKASQVLRERADPAPFPLSLFPRPRTRTRATRSISLGSRRKFRASFCSFP